MVRVLPAGTLFFALRRKKKSTLPSPAQDYGPDNNENAVIEGINDASHQYS